MRKHLAALVLIAGTAATVTGCGENLDIPNRSNPDVAKIYATPSGVEGAIAGLGAQVFNTQRASESLNTQASIFSGENFATVNNFGMALRGLIPRTIIDNNLGNDNSAGNLANYNQFQRVARTAANTLISVNKLLDDGKTLGSPGQNNRAKAFAFMILGEALGNVALGYDSAAVASPSIPSDSVPGLSGAADVGALALSMLDSAAFYGAKPEAAGGFPLPNNWLSQDGVTQTRFVQIVRSYAARIRAGLARTPSERAAVDWAKVIADATNGITEDLEMQIGGSSGWSAGYDASQMYVVGGWHQFPTAYVGMIDMSGGYENWLATPNSQRQAFLVVTSDKRWPQGATRAAQQANTPTQILDDGVYVRNRPTGEDISGQGFGYSWYDHSRYGGTRNNNGIGPYTDMSATEISMLAAEGYIRTGNLPAAIALVNESRVRNNLPALPTNLSSADAPYSSDLSTCTPHMPAPSNLSTTQCASLLEAMKYEKRIETAFTGYMIWFTDSRGWNDLVEGTVVEWPVPYQEMQNRQLPFYNGERRQGKGTYGY